jgi:hypothetical protein
MTFAFTKPTVVPTHSVKIGTSFCTTSVTSTSGGGGVGGVARVQPVPTIASMTNVAANPSGHAQRRTAGSTG